MSTAVVEEVFRSTKHGNIAGVLVTEGTLRNRGTLSITRDGEVIAEVHTHSLRRYADDLKSVPHGTQCGISVGHVADVRIGDVITQLDEQGEPAHE